MTLGDDQSIIEGLMTTLNPRNPRSAKAPGAERVNISPMGPIVDVSMSELVLRPFNTSTTYRNLKAKGQGVFHVTDNALMIAQAAIGQLKCDEVELRAAAKVEGLILCDACRFYEFEVVELDDRSERTCIRAKVVASGRQRDCFGFNRARHAVVEAAILATRVHLTGTEPVLEEFDRLAVTVDKTGSRREHKAMALLRSYVQEGGR